MYVAELSFLNWSLQLQSEKLLELIQHIFDRLVRPGYMVYTLWMPKTTKCYCEKREDNISVYMQTGNFTYRSTARQRDMF